MLGAPSAHESLAAQALFGRTATYGLLEVRMFEKDLRRRRLATVELVRRRPFYVFLLRAA